MNSFLHKRRKSGNEGVAIIIVLGLLAIMIIAAAAFTVFIQVERRGAANQQHTIQAKHMLWAALGNAIHEIDTNNYVNIVWPDWDFFVSRGTGSVSENAYIFSSTIMDFLPGNLRSQISGTMSNPPQWKLIRNPSNEVVGRYAFIAINMSGLLDANIVGRSNRVSGANAEEICLSAILPELGIDGAKFYKKALVGPPQGFYRYETLSELVNLSTPSVLGPNSWRDEYPSSFCVYSLAPEWPLSSGIVTQQIYIGGSGSGWGDVKTGFQQAGLTAAQADLARINLIDFVDADNVPSRDAGNRLVGVEMVPMINEVILYYQLTYDAAKNINARFKLGFECWYPFITNSTESFDMECDIVVSKGPKNNADNAIPKLSQKWTETVPNIIPTKKSFSISSRPSGGGGWWTSVGSPPAGVTNLYVQFEVGLGIKIKRSSGAKEVVDEVPSPYPATFAASKDNINLRIELPFVPPGTSIVTNNWAEAEDPRFNHDAKYTVGMWLYGKAPFIATYPPGGGNPYIVLTASQYPQGKFPSLSTTNDTTKAYIAEPASDADGDCDMYVANRPLRTVGELGLICYDKWKTIRLYKHAGSMTLHNVYDVFTLHKESTYKRGLVNGNSLNQAVLASVFYNAPENEYDPAITNKVINEIKAKSIATDIINNGPYRNVSEVVAKVNWPAYVTGDSEIAKESVIRNSMDLLTTRHNLFTVIIGAESYSEMIGGYERSGGNVLGNARGVAEVWRDPFPDSNGVHKCFVRYFKIIND